MTPDEFTAWLIEKWDEQVDSYNLRNHSTPWIHIDPKELMNTMHMPPSILAQKNL